MDGAHIVHRLEVVIRKIQTTFFFFFFFLQDRGCGGENVNASQQSLYVVIAYFMIESFCSKTLTRSFVRLRIKRHGLKKLQMSSS